MTSDFDYMDKLEFDTPDELLCMAAEIERNAAIQYRHLAAEMTRHGNDKASEIFTRLAEEEEAHATAVEYFQSGSVAEHGADDAATTGEADVIREWEQEGRSPYSLSPSEAFDLAVRNEERAFSFFVYIAANCVDQAVRETAERLAAEELQHLALVRLERRRMRRDEVAQEQTDVPPETTQPEDLEQRLVDSAYTLWQAASEQGVTALRELASPLASRKKDIDQSEGKNLLQALRDHIIDVDRFCDKLISEVTSDQPPEKTDVWLTYLADLHEQTGQLLGHSD